MITYTDEKYIKSMLRPRESDAHKGDFGRVLIFAGSPGMAGAAVLCGRAALRTGSGLVQFLLPDLADPIYPILQTAVPEATCVQYHKDFDWDRYDAVAAGPGLGKSDERKIILSDLLSYYQRKGNDHETTAGKDLFADERVCFPKKNNSAVQTIVLDADALNMMSESLELSEMAAGSCADIVITPHVGEAKRLLETCAGIATLTDRKNAVQDLAEKFNCVAVLKGAGTLVAVNKTSNKLSSDILICQNTTGNPGMAAGGSGDVLTGIITSLAGQGYSCFDAARMGVYLHGLAGDISARKLGQMSVIATDIAENISAALMSVQTEV